ncbi:mechanosensitive ion channel [Sphingomonas sp.]|uniref:mechanosensitive ion channel n=1 Tax=Sphingomonas sp. TaxID=28214 RepID=UPI00286B6E3D|nr:mechanosensitive ion channel [Sphingomonas sp.]
MYQNTQPAAYWREQLMSWGPKVLLAIVILVATHFIAKAVQWAIAKLVDKMPILKRDPGVGGDSVGKELGRLAYWLVWLVGLIAALQPLGLSEVMTPLTRMTNEIFAYIPRMVGAGILFFAGVVLARIVRHVIEAAFGAINIERLLGRVGMSISEPPLAVDQEGTVAPGVSEDRSSIAKALGMTASAVIIIFAAIAALNILQISAIADPATAMLTTIANAIPNILAALAILAFTFIIGRYFKSLIEAVLPSFGFDRSVHALNIMPASTSPSRVVGSIAMTALLIIGVMEAARKIGGDSTAALLFQITELGGKVIFGTVIIVVGLFLARILAGLVGSSTGEAGYAQTIVKYAIVALFTAIGLTFMGLANEIVMIAFGLILGSAAVATAIAFGLGGRDFAARTLEQWQDSNAPPAPRIPPRLKQPVATEDDGQPPLV